MSLFLKATMPRLNPKLINYMKMLINLRDHCPPESDTEVADPSKMASRRNPSRCHTAVAVSGSAHIASPSKESADEGFTLDAESAVPSPGFITVAYKKEIASGASAVNTVKYRRRSLIAIRNAALCQLFQNRQGPRLSLFRVLALKFLLMMLRSP
jgi:hypothetical protein